MIAAQGKEETSDFATSILVLPDLQSAAEIAKQVFTDYKKATNPCEILGFTGKVNGQILTIVGLENRKLANSDSTRFRELFMIDGVERIVYVSTCLSSLEYVEIGDIILTTSAYIDSTDSTLAEYINSHVSNPQTKQMTGAGISSNYHPGKKTPGIVYAPSSSLEPLQAAIGATDLTDRVHTGTIVSNPNLYEALHTLANTTVDTTINTAKNTRDTEAGKANADNPDTGSSPKGASVKTAKIALGSENLPQGALGVDSDSAALFISAAQLNKQALSVMLVSEHVTKTLANSLAPLATGQKTNFTAAVKLAIAAALC